MSDASPISLKVKLEEDIRRFSVSRDITYVDLRNLVAKHFALAPENVHLKYVDDEEELITLGSDLELQEAKRLQPTVLRLNAYARSSKGPAQVPLLEAQFVRDVTVPDSTSVSAGVRFNKVWRVKNCGPASWPDGVMLKMVDPSDNHLLVLAAGTIKRAVAPGEETDIGVDLQAPSRPGRCHQHWRLFTPDGEAFGPRLWLDIMVIPSNESALAQAEAEIRQKEQEQLEAERRLEHELAVRKLEELERIRLAEEAAELERRAVEEEELRKQQEEERRRQEEEEDRRRQEEELRKQQQEEEERRRQEEEAAEIARMEEEAAAARKMQEEEEARRRQEEEEAAAAAAAAESLRRQQEEEAEIARREQIKRQEEERKKADDEKAQQLFRKYPSQLVALTEMGFSDLERNVQLLDRHKGSLDLALEALLSATN